MIDYISVCAGIEAATVAAEGLGWNPLVFSEIEAFPRAVLNYHYSEVPMHGDFTTMKGHEYGSANLLIGGTPCQSFSIAGKRLGLDDPRGNLALEYLALGLRANVDWFLWENVTGVLSSAEGEDFAAFISAATGYHYKAPESGWANAGIAQGRPGRWGIAWRVLDAQYFGVPQRRRRVFVVGYTGDWRPATAVLFEPESLRRDITPVRTARKTDTAGADGSLEGNGIPEVAWALQERDYKGADSDTKIGHLIPVAFKIRGGCDGGGKGYLGSEDKAFTIATGQDQQLFHQKRVRKLTPLECERLQGFPDDYTLIPNFGADAPRIKALGNSMAVPVMKWILSRIDMVNNIINQGVK